MQRRRLSTAARQAHQLDPAPAALSLFRPLKITWDAEYQPHKTYSSPSARQLRAIHLMARQGMGVESIAFCVGVTTMLFNNWLQEIPAVMHAVRSGHAAGEELASRVITAGIQEGNSKCAMFYLRSRHSKQWRDQDAGNFGDGLHENGQTNALAQTLKRLTDEEVRVIASALARAAGRAVIDG